jgi:AcrR family transcriptional regulator
MPRRPASTPVPRKLPKQERATLTIDAIVTAVERILEQQGPGALTTNRIAEVAGVSVGTLYQWFPNKEALIAALQDRYLEQTLGLCRSALAAAGSVPLAAAVDAVAAALVAAYHAQRPIHRWLTELRTSAGYQGRWREAFAAFTADVAAFLARHPEADVADPGAAAFVVVHALEGLGEAIGAERDLRAIDPIAREGAAMIRRYLCATGQARDA